MGVKVAATCFHWSSQPIVPHPPSSAAAASYSSCHTLSAASSTSSLSSLRRRGSAGCDGLVRRSFVHGTDTSPFLGARLLRSRSFDNTPARNRRLPQQNQTLRRAVSATLAENYHSDDDDEEFIRRLQELALRCQDDAAAADLVFPGSSRNQGGGESTSGLRSQDSFDGIAGSGISPSCTASSSHAPSQVPLPTPQPRKMVYRESPANAVAPPPWLGIRPEPPDWTEERGEIVVPASVERNANSVDLPLSLRILKRKKQWEEGWSLREAGESARCSVRKAFSSMVFIIRELQSYSLQLREALFYEDLQGVLVHVQKEMDASFCWLFGQVFSCTPALMVSVMLLLANFTVYSMAHNVAIAASYPPPFPAPPRSYAAAATVLPTEDDHHHMPLQSARFGVSSVRTFSISGKTASVGGNGGGGGKVRPVAGSTDDGRWRDGSPASFEQRPRSIVPDGTSTVPTGTSEEGKEAAVTAEDEGKVWSRVVEEAARMQAASREETLMDHETLQRFVSPVTAVVESDEDYPEYFRTELMYQQAVNQEPVNALLLCNYAQFLFLVAHDHDRAEYYFKRAVGVQPADGEALSQYANFLWMGKKDLAAAEETYLEAIGADPGNTFHAANYAHFLWNTGGEDTCYPLSGPDDEDGGETA